MYYNPTFHSEIPMDYKNIGIYSVSVLKKFKVHPVLNYVEDIIR